MWRSHVHRHSKSWSFSCCTGTAAPSHFTAGHNQVTFLLEMAPEIRLWIELLVFLSGAVMFFLFWDVGGLIWKGINVECRIGRFYRWRWGRCDVPKRRAPVTEWYDCTSQNNVDLKVLKYIRCMWLWQQCVVTAWRQYLWCEDTYVDTHTHTRARARAHTYIHTHACMHTYTHTHSHIHTYTHIHKYIIHT